MNNYANWEITQLLPEINPYFEYGKSLVWITEKELDVHLSYSNLAGEMIENHYIRQGWSFEDIRLYLESKGYYICISILYFNINEYYADIYEQNEIFSDSSTWLHSKRLELYISYEQAREEAIKYCLTKINL